MAKNKNNQEIEENKELEELNKNNQEVEENKILENKETEIKLVDLEVKIPFIDKYDETKKYITGDIIQVNEKRAKELLEDKRKLVVLTSE